MQPPRPPALARRQRLLAIQTLAALLLTACRASPEPAAQYRALAHALANEVVDGSITDCEALARFADSAAPLEAYNVFIPRSKANYPLGRPLGLVGVARPIKLEGRTSGYRRELRKGHEPDRRAGTAHDQAHHFAPYLILGFRIPAWLARGFLVLAERPESWGDLNLGSEAIALGAAWAQRGLEPEQLGIEIRRRLCAPQ